MNPEYKILRMKDLAEKLDLKEARSFKKSEAYLEYAIKEINAKSKYYWYQYLFLIDILYVVIVAKSSVESAYATNPARSSVSGMTSSSATTGQSGPRREKQEKEVNAMPPTVKLGDDSLEDDHSKVRRTKLSWNH